MKHSATAQIAISLIAKSLDQMLISLDEIQSLAPSLGTGERDRLVLEVLTQCDRLNTAYDKCTELIALLSSEVSLSEV